MQNTRLPSIPPVRKAEAEAAWCRADPFYNKSCGRPVSARLRGQITRIVKRPLKRHVEKWTLSGFFSTQFYVEKFPHLGYIYTQC